MKKAIVFLLVALATGYYFYSKHMAPQRVRAGLVTLICETDLPSKTKGIFAGLLAAVQAANGAKNVTRETAMAQAEKMSGTIQKIGQDLANYIAAHPDLHDQLKPISSLPEEKDKDLEAQLALEVTRKCPEKADDLTQAAFSAGLAVGAVRKIRNL
jgi:hypothetical protein